MTPTINQIKTWFNEYNQSVFSGELPVPQFKLTNTRRQLGQFYWGNGRGIGIKISLYYDRPEIEYRNTLVHEMCHLYCYNRGWLHEGHGQRWKDIALYAGRKTGMNITRVHEGACNWDVAKGNEAKAASVQKKRTEAKIFVDIDYGTYHFIVKTNDKGLISSDSTDSNWKPKIYRGKIAGVYITDNPKFHTWQTSRSIHRGYKYDNWEYEKKILPELRTGTSYETLRDAYFAYRCK